MPNFFFKYRPLHIFLLFYFFHLFLSVCLFLLANTNILMSMHNGEGIWNLYPDVSSYHEQALRVYNYILNGKIGIIDDNTNNKAAILAIL